MPDQRDEHEIGLDDEMPWASPEIQINYEAALGRFMLAFNRLDNQLTKIIEVVLGRLRRADLVSSCTHRDFQLKLLAADLLKHSHEGDGLVSISISTMKEINAHRNKIAHGHFDQDPISGEYDIVGKNVRATYSDKDLDRLADRTNIAWRTLRLAEAFYQFSDAPNL